MKVLLVDDDPDMALLVQAVLDDPDDELTVATRGGAALAMAVAVAPDVVMLDVMLPDTSGMDVLQRLRAAEATRATPVVVCSASTNEQQIAELRALGATSVLRKPFDPLELRQLLIDASGAR